MTTLVKINAIDMASAEAGPRMEEKFLSRKHSMDKVPGFQGYQLLRPIKGDDRYFVVTYWASQEAFDDWMEYHMAQTHDMNDDTIATGNTLLEFEVAMEVPGSGV